MTFKIDTSDLQDVRSVSGGDELLFQCWDPGCKYFKAYYNPKKGAGFCQHCHATYFEKDRSFLDSPKEKLFIPPARPKKEVPKIAVEDVQFCAEYLKKRYEGLPLDYSGMVRKYRIQRGIGRLSDFVGVELSNKEFQFRNTLRRDYLDSFDSSEIWTSPTQSEHLVICEGIFGAIAAEEFHLKLMNRVVKGVGILGSRINKEIVALLAPLNSRIVTLYLDTRQLSWGAMRVLRRYPLNFPVIRFLESACGDPEDDFKCYLKEKNGL